MIESRFATETAEVERLVVNHGCVFRVLDIHTHPADRIDCDLRLRRFFSSTSSSSAQSSDFCRNTQCDLG